MTQKEQVKRLLNGVMFPMTPAEVAKVLDLPRPSVRRVIRAISTQRWNGRYARVVFHPFQHNMN